MFKRVHTLLRQAEPTLKEPVFDETLFLKCFSLLHKTSSFYILPKPYGIQGADFKNNKKRNKNLINFILTNKK